ncbi:GTPase Era [Bdellovibrionota bacterium FG-2]
MKSGFVAVIGRPNSGKSTLINQILGTQLSIVSPKAQTTREKVLGILTEKQGQMIFMDTPGIHRAKEGGINEFMVGEARGALDTPCVIWYLIDPASRLEHEKAVIELLGAAGVQKSSSLMILMTKSDIARGAIVPKLKGEVSQALEALGYKIHSDYMISALKDKGVNLLLEATWNLFEEGPLYYPDEEQLSDRPTRFFVSEMIREKLFLHLGEEVPYSCAVEIDKFQESSKPPRIEATIYVERESQKGMVVGKSGSKIKEIGQSARADIEVFLGHKVFLGLNVKVLKEWTRSPDAMKRFGYKLKKKPQTKPPVKPQFKKEQA